MVTVRVLLFGAAVALILAGCGSKKVAYGLACDATCGDGHHESIAEGACSEAGGDLVSVAADNVDECIAAADAMAGCDDVTCTCVAVETADSCS